MESTEKRLLKNEEYGLMYNAQISDMLNRNVAKKLSNSEISAYTGPVHYITHHDVLKPESTSTPCRIVFNSSANYQGHILNDYWAKGPDMINNMVGILIRFREHPHALVGDISKMYHAIKLSEVDQHTHRFLWRFLDTSMQPETYVMTSVSFGDRPSGNISITALKKTAELFLHEYPRAA